MRSLPNTKPYALVAPKRSTYTSPASTAHELTRIAYSQTAWRETPKSQIGRPLSTLACIIGHPQPQNLSNPHVIICLTPRACRHAMRTTSVLDFLDCNAAQQLHDLLYLRCNPLLALSRCSPNLFPSAFSIAVDTRGTFHWPTDWSELARLKCIPKFNIHLRLSHVPPHGGLGALLSAFRIPHAPIHLIQRHLILLHRMAFISHLAFCSHEFLGYHNIGRMGSGI